jgi:CheY-like chemotaxis protein
MINVLTNAVKYTQKGVVSLHIWSEPIDRHSLRLFIQVRDTGIGIQKSDLTELFLSFQRFDTHKNRNIQGTGLGLAITKRLSEMMGGGITADSKYGEGSTFTINITARLVEGVPPTPVAALEKGDLNILVYEPNPYEAEAMQEMLEDLGTTFTFARSPEELAVKISSEQYTHVFFHREAKDVIRQFFGKNSTNFIMLKGSIDTFDKDIPNAIMKPTFIWTLANMLNGRRNYDSSLGITVNDQQMQYKVHDVSALIVDDNVVNLKVAAGLLGKYGFITESVTSGLKALEKVKEKDYDVIFMDHMMPGMDGIECTQAIRALKGKYEKQLIIALSANAVSGMREQFLEAGMNDFLVKPIIAQDLQKIIKTWFEAKINK